jgi:hypothetical protein
MHWYQMQRPEILRLNAEAINDLLVSLTGIRTAAEIGHSKAPFGRICNGYWIFQ